MELGRLPLVKTAAKLARGFCYGNKDRLLAGMIIAGWDPVDGGSVYEIPLGGTMIKQKFALGGSGSTYMCVENSVKLVWYFHWIGSRVNYQSIEPGVQ